MSLEFGLTMTLLGVLSMFSALALIVVACEILKRWFKKEEPTSVLTEALIEVTPLRKEEMSGEEEAAVTAAIAAYLSEAPASRRVVAISEKGTRPMMWSMAGRIELMDKRIRRGW